MKIIYLILLCVLNFSLFAMEQKSGGNQQKSSQKQSQEPQKQSAISKAIKNKYCSK